MSPEQQKNYEVFASITVTFHLGTVNAPGLAEAEETLYPKPGDIVRLLQDTINDCRLPLKDIVVWAVDSGPHIIVKDHTRNDGLMETP